VVPEAVRVDARTDRTEDDRGAAVERERRVVFDVVRTRLDVVEALELTQSLP